MELVDVAQVGDPNVLVREVFPLTEHDVLMLEQEGPHHTVRPLKRIRAFHHTIAIALAAGRRESEIAATLGMTPSAISNLKQSEPFMELVAAYTGQAAEETFKMVPIMSTIGMEAMMEIHDRLIDPQRREKMGMGDLRGIANDMLNRTGYSEVKRTEAKVETNRGVDPDFIKDLREALREDVVEAAVDVTPTSGTGQAAGDTGTQKRTRSVVEALRRKTEGTERESEGGPSLREEVPAIPAKTSGGEVVDFGRPAHNPGESLV